MRLCMQLVVAGIALGWSCTRLVWGQEATSGRPSTLFLVGDSTVKNGSDAGSGRLWGWGHFLQDRLDPARFRVENRALGGRSSRTYRTEGLWAKVVAQLHPGDVVLIQFGHNDGGPIDTGRARASLKGVGEDIREATIAGKPVEVVHSYGWYLRQSVREAKDKGATPVICSPVPRNIWSAEGKVVRASQDYARWAAEVAASEQVLFLDLNTIVADRYETLGRDQVSRDYFTVVDHTHTTEAGARFSAGCVADGLKALGQPRLTDAVHPANQQQDRP